MKRVVWVIEKVIQLKIQLGREDTGLGVESLRCSKGDVSLSVVVLVQWDHAGHSYNQSGCLIPSQHRWQKADRSGRADANPWNFQQWHVLNI